MSSRIGEFGRGEGGAGPKNISGFEISSGWHLWFPCCLTAATYIFRTSWISNCPIAVLFFVPGEVSTVFQSNTSHFSLLLCRRFKCALVLEVEPAQYLKVAEQILQIFLDLSLVPSSARKP